MPRGVRCRPGARPRRAAPGVLQGFGEQPAEHAAGVQRQGEGPGVRPEPGRQHHQRAPDQLRHRAQRIEQESRQALRRHAEATCRRQREEQAEQRRQQGADGRHGQGFQQPPANRPQVRSGQVGREELAGVGGHLAQSLAAEKTCGVHVQIGERGAHRGHYQQRPEQQAPGPAHASLPRRKRLSRSARRTSRRKVSRMLATSPPANIRSDRSICWPRPPAPTKPITTEARIAHSQR